MEQSRLGMHDMLHQEHQSLHDQHFNSSANLRAPKISLRSMSKSDPHLNIPHLMMSQDEDHPSLNKIVSGLFHADTVLSAAPHLHSAPMSAGHSNNALKPCESSATLLREPSDNTPSLRKSSSAVSWTFADKGQELFPWSPSDNSVKSSTTAFLPGLALNQVSEHHHHTQGGLVMSSTTTDSKMSVLVPAAPNHAAFSPSLASAASSSMSVPAINPLEPQVASHDRKNYGMFGNMFRQGFFSRPVVRSDEENYRYIMALDR